MGLLGLLLTAGVPFIGETQASKGKGTGEELPVLRPGLEGSGKVWQESSDAGGKEALNPKWPSTKLEGGSEDMTNRRRLHPNLRGVPKGIHYLRTMQS